MTDEDLTLPSPILEAHAIGFCLDHDGHDFQPDDLFDCSVETTRWWREWNGNPDLGAPPFRVFGMDGSGGRAAFWIREATAPLETQPIIFIGSEGETAVLARDLGDYLWLLANGVGPLETVDGLRRVPTPIPELVALAQRSTGLPARPLDEVTEAAAALLPSLMDLADSSGTER